LKKLARDANATLVGLCLDSATAEFITKLHDAGFEVLLYTVNELRLIHRAIDLGADGVIIRLFRARSENLADMRFAPKLSLPHRSKLFFLGASRSALCLLVSVN
jgi:hypothetical protein